MSLDKLAVLAESIGALGVIISVIYLAIQIRKQTEEARLAATRQLAAQFQDSLKSVGADEKLSEIWLKGVKSYESLPDVDRFRVAVMFHDLFRNVEQQYFHTGSGNIESLYLDSMERYFVELLSFPGVQSWWKSSSHSFEVGFQQHIERMMMKSESASFTSTFNHRHDELP